MSTLLQDLRFALRSFGRNPAFAIVAVLTVALGIGGNSALFTLVNAVILKSLPVRAPEELVAIASRDADSGSDTSFSYPMYRDLRDRNSVLAGLLARGAASFSASDGASSERLDGELVSGNYYEVLGVQPAAGRFFTQEDDKADAPAVAVISWGYWQRHFGGDRSAVGREIELNGHRATILGVSPRGFYGTSLGGDPEVRLPMSNAPRMRSGTNLESRRHQWMTLLGRRKPGVSTVQAQAGLETLFRQIITNEAAQLSPGVSESRRKRFLERHMALEPGRQGFARTRELLEMPLTMLLAVTGLVLLIACANLAGLLLVRGAYRQKEIMMRSALGAGRFRLVRQLLTENILLSAFGGVAGFLASYWITSALLGMFPQRYNMKLDATPDATVFGYCMGAAILTGLVFGLIPALHATRGAGQASALKADSGSIARGERVLSLRGAMLVAQVALSMVLLFGAGLFLRTLRNLQTLDTGFQRGSVLIASAAPYLNGYKGEAARALAARIVERVREIDGVKAAGWSAESLIAGGWDQNTIVVEGYRPKGGDPESSHFDQISPGFLAAVGMQLAAGRDFTDRDSTGALKVALVNESFARHFFPGQSAIGKHFGFEGPNAKPDLEIVGVVRDARYVNLRESKAPVFAYVPVAQSDIFTLTLHVRTVGDPAKFAALLREQVRAIDPRLPLFGIRTLESQVDDSLVQERVMATLVSAFGGLATVLAALGLYGVLAFSVTRRSREIGVRMALGAQASQVAGLVLRQTGFLIGAGLVLGIAGSLALSGVARSMLYGVTAADPLSLVLAATTLGCAALTAAYLPARRAARIDPIEALRQE